MTNMINILQAQIDRELVQLAKLQRFQPEPEIGTVLSFRVRFGGPFDQYGYARAVYDYVFLHADDGTWRSTATAGHLSASAARTKGTWDELVNWLTDERLTIVGAYEVAEWTPVDDWVDEPETAEEEIDPDA